MCFWEMNKRQQEHRPLRLQTEGPSAVYLGEDIKVGVVQKQVGARSCRIKQAVQLA
jgi:hypothetical protein